MAQGTARPPPSERAPIRRLKPDWRPPDDAWVQDGVSACKDRQRRAEADSLAAEGKLTWDWLTDGERETVLRLNARYQSDAYEQC
jgi:hypothetical protein